MNIEAPIHTTESQSVGVEESPRRRYYCALLNEFTQPHFVDGIQDNTGVRLIRPEASIWNRILYARDGLDQVGSVTLTKPADDGNDLFLQATQTCGNCAARMDGICNPQIGELETLFYDGQSNNAYQIDKLTVAIRATCDVKFPYPQIAKHENFEA